MPKVQLANHKTQYQRLIELMFLIKNNINLCLIVSAYESSSASSSSGSTGTNFQLPTDMQSSKFTRTPPPTFSDNRIEWAEFRAIWKRYGEHEFANGEKRAWAFKGSLRGRALELVKAVFVIQPNAYQRMWDRLENVYSDISHTVQNTFVNLNALTHVKSDDLLPPMYWC